MKTETLATSPSQVADRLSPERINTIDILRAITMVTMVFVNDLWSLTNIPQWLLHVDVNVDGMGLSDVIFPAFLFIVGLSIPYALKNRRRKGDSTAQLLGHVVWRSVALLVMGVWLVNGEGINAEATGIPRWVWGPVVCTCFIMIWHQYDASRHRLLAPGLRALAIVILLVLAWIYRGGPDDALRTFGPRWWGILGLIGWAYLASATIAVFARNRIPVIFGFWLFFCLLSIMHHAGMIPSFLNFIPPAIRGGTLTALALGGVLTALVFEHYRQLGKNKTLTLVLACAAIALFGLSVILRPYWGISKQYETPSWLFVCSAITIAAFLVLYWIVDIGGKAHWFRWAKPAGVATLLCYLMPHYGYFIKQLSGIPLPDVMLSGALGLMKSFLFALLCVWFTGLLLRAGIRMRL
jgi:heparan-alpha-glucosaminide N-acetyltransferase